MRYLRKRGRPAVERPEIDLGTIELQRRRKHCLTDEPIDVCLKRGYITCDQHKSGMHFRWLHNMRYGKVGVRSVDVANLGGVERKLENLKWSSAREREYQRAMERLKARAVENIALDICVYNEFPQFLRFTNRKFFTLSDKKSQKQVRLALNILTNDFNK